jgi:vacuolar-type H+-ATPase subunit H
VIFLCDSTVELESADGTALFCTFHEDIEKGCTMDSVESIDRLVEIEHQAAALIHDAEEKATQTLLDARTKAESSQGQKVVELRKKFEADYEAFLESLRKQVQQEIQDYKKNLSAIPLNHAALADTLRGLLGAEV